jgi:transcriptional regulator with XRE-family HTH domain
MADHKEQVFDLSELLRRYRTVRGIKQIHLAEIINVSQGTISKWENGTTTPNAGQYFQIIELLGANPSAVQDTWLARLIETSHERIHAVCDITHRLLVASPARYQEWCSDRSEMFHRPLLQDAPDDIVDAEHRLVQRSRSTRLDEPLIVRTRGQAVGPDRRYRVEAGLLLWERLQLADGTWVRLVTSIAPDRIPKRAITV